MQPKARILDVYGAFARDVGGWIAIADLIALMGLFGVEEQVVRSAASRMKRRGLLESKKIGGSAGYVLSEKALGILTDGDARIFRDVTVGADTPWIIAMFSVPEAERQQRYKIRSGLARLGFGQGPAASWFAPAWIQQDAERMLRRAELERYVTLWQGSYVGFGDIADLVAAGWDLDETLDRYQEFRDTFGPVAVQWSEGTFSDEAAFTDYLACLGMWRPLPYLDPGLPASVTPDGWPGEACRSLFLDLERRLRPQAMRFFISAARPSSVG